MMKDCSAKTNTKLYETFVNNKSDRNAKSEGNAAMSQENKDQVWHV